VAYLALFLALAGTSYAAAKITGKQIKDSSITSADVKNRSLLAKDFKAGQLPAGARGQQGAQGLPGQNGADGAPGAPGAAKGFASVGVNGAVDPTRSAGVISVTHPDIGTISLGTDDNLYCFDLSFDARIAVASPLVTNNGAGQATAADGGQGGPIEANCQAPNDDALVQTYNGSGNPSKPGFSVIFE
jgi:hypothetical protein